MIDEASTWERVCSVELRLSAATEYAVRISSALKRTSYTVLEREILNNGGAAKCVDESLA